MIKLYFTYVCFQKPRSIRVGFVIIQGILSSFFKEVIFIREKVNLILFEIFAREIIDVMLEITELCWVKTYREVSQRPRTSSLVAKRDHDIFC